MSIAEASRGGGLTGTGSARRRCRETASSRRQPSLSQRRRRFALSAATNLSMASSSSSTARPRRITSYSPAAITASSSARMSRRRSRAAAARRSTAASDAACRGAFLATATDSAKPWRPSVANSSQKESRFCQQPVAMASRRVRSGWQARPPGLACASRCADGFGRGLRTSIGLEVPTPRSPALVRASRAAPRDTPRLAPQETSASCGS